MGEQFQSTPPARGATHRRRRSPGVGLISIHAPVGGAAPQGYSTIPPSRFQSAFPARGAANAAAPFRKLFGEGVADKLAGKLVSRFGENAAVQTMNRLAQTSVGRLAASALGEGSEEFIEDVFQPVLQRATYDPSAQFELSEALYDAAVGAALGGIGGAVDIVNRRGADAAGEAEADSAGTGTPQAETGAEGPVNAGRVTTIQRPYRGTVPVQTQKSASTVAVGGESVNAAADRIRQAQSQEGTGRGFKSALKNIYKSVFRPVRGVPVSGMTYEGQPYTVDINSNVPGKVISDSNLTAEKLALLDMLPQVVQNGEYVGSGEYVQHSGRSRPGVRYDYFETPITVNGQNYIAKFDVEVLPGANNYRTHQLINMNLTPSEARLAGQSPVPSSNMSGSVEGTRPLNSDSTIAPGAENVNATAPFSRS